MQGRLISESSGSDGLRTLLRFARLTRQELDHFSNHCLSAHTGAARTIDLVELHTRAGGLYEFQSVGLVTSDFERLLGDDQIGHNLILRPATLSPGPVVTDGAVMQAVAMAPEENPLPTPQAAPAQNTAMSAPVDTESVSGVDWRNVVRAEAWEQWVKTLAENGTPTLENVPYHLANWCINNHVNANMGKPPAAGYIKTHVIDGKHWNPPRHLSREATKKHLEQKKQEKPAN